MYLVQWDDLLVMSKLILIITESTQIAQEAPKAKSLVRFRKKDWTFMWIISLSGVSLFVNLHYAKPTIL